MATSYAIASVLIPFHSGLMSGRAPLFNNQADLGLNPLSFGAHVRTLI